MQESGITRQDITQAVAALGVSAGDTLFVHSDLRSALRVSGDRPRDKMETIVDGLAASVARGTLMMPTFTYSSCEHEDFDLAATPSRVGALTEWFRRLPQTRRTTDPIFSVGVQGDVGEDWEGLFEIGDVDCFGPASVFALLRAVNAKLLFFGVGFGSCTYVHHVEQRLGVDYRYFKPFPGAVVDGSERTAVTADYFVRDLEADVVPYLEPLGQALLETGEARGATLPDGPSMLCVDAAAVERMVVHKLERQPDFLLQRGHAGATAS